MNGRIGDALFQHLAISLLQGLHVRQRSYRGGRQPRQSQQRLQGDQDGHDTGIGVHAIEETRLALRSSSIHPF